MNFIVIDKNTGDVLRGGDVPGSDIPRQVQNDDECAIALANGVMKWDGSPLDLEKQAAYYHARIDADAEAIRLQYITPGSGQTLTYLRKLDAARGYLAGAPLTDAQMARITHEAARLNVTAEQAAESLVAIGDTWDALDAALDNARLVAKQAITDATSILEQDNAAQVDWVAVLAP
jgi:hypothetical protein